MHYAYRYTCPLGSLLLTSDGQHLNGLWMEGQKYFGGTYKETLAPDPGRAEFKNTSNWLDAYFRGQNPGLGDLALTPRPRGTAFQQAVWRQLLNIPYGETRTYAAIALQLAHDTGKSAVAGQAVGSAVGHNPIAIIIPCHRVVGSNGSLTGYAGGLHKKIHLLTLEGVNTAKFFVPRQGTAL